MMLGASTINYEDRLRNRELRAWTLVTMSRPRYSGVCRNTGNSLPKETIVRSLGALAFLGLMIVQHNDKTNQKSKNEKSRGDEQQPVAQG